MTSYQASLNLNDSDDNDQANDFVSRPTLNKGDRIVWISDNGPEYGFVRWLGKLPDLGKEWMAGVEFDNPVGSGTGLYKDKQLFSTALNHASLVPIIGLLKASDFDDEPQELQSMKKSNSSSIRLIDFNDSDYNRYAGPNRHQNSSKSPNLFDDVDHHHQYQRFQQQQQQQQQQQPQSNRINDVATMRENSQAKKQPNSGRIRNIPIRIINSSNTDSNSSKPTHQIDSSTNINKQAAACREIGTDQPRLVKELTSSLNRTTLQDSNVGKNSKTNPQRTNLSSLPPPALIVENNEKNPSLALKNLLGKSRGIQGHNNSCYLDATLFAMFSSTTLFDSLLYRPPNRNDISEYDEIQRILREEIVRPLREDFIVSADQVMVFRTMLERSSTVEGLTDEEKDPEEFLSLLLSQILKADPYLKLSSGLESFFYQLIVDKDESVILPTVQDLFEQSFMNSTIRLQEIPPCLLLQMPRFGRQYKMYQRIMPSLKLDITDVLEAAPRACGHRGKDCDNIAKYECKSCFGESSGNLNARLSSITYCHNCFQSKHFGKAHLTGIEDHDKTKTLLDKTPSEAIARYSNSCKSSSSGAHAKDKEIPRICMDLFAVLCIETSHYVCFVKCGQNSDSPWCFFDSMADRRGEQNGYNIPEVLLFDEFSFWTSNKGVTYLLNHKDDKLLPEMARRLICDAYLCFYQYPGLANYR